MGEPAAVTYKQVERAVKGTDGNAYDVWRKIGEITGAGAPGLDHDGDASIDITNESDSVRSRIDKLLGVAAEEPADESKAGPKAVKKEGK